MKPQRRLLIFLALLLPLVTGCTEPLNKVERIKAKGYLTVVTRNAGTTYYEASDGPTGLEYELVRGFANELGVGLRLIVASNVSDVLARLSRGEADMAAAGLTATPKRKRWFRFSAPYQEITQQLVYRYGSGRPNSLADLSGKLEVTAKSSHAETMRVLSDLYSSINWEINGEGDSEDLLTRVWEKEIEYTLVDSNEFQLNQRFFPELRVAFDVTEPEPLAWAFRKVMDDSLSRAASDYIKRQLANGELAQLIERHYGHLNEFDYVGTRAYMRHIEERLPLYEALFKKSAKQYELDWRLLAAMAYQESHWNKHAVSPTGVKGIMMLTEATAEHIGVSDRTDPVQSIDGGARYLLGLIDKVPERISNPDRIWFALAAYNIGFGHLEDARIITERRGYNPDSWKDVKQHLPLLRQKKWYKTVKRGYARGNEAVQYVENIRSYYDILLWRDEKANARQASKETEAAIITITRPSEVNSGLQLSDSASSDR